MDEADAAIALHAARKALESEGVRPSKPATMLDLRLHLGVVVDALKALRKENAELRRRLDGQQVKLDHADSHGLKFAGQWAPERTFHPADTVRHDGRIYTCLRTIAPGGQPPNRPGSPWALIV